MNERRYDLDWLRVFTMGAVFLFHCARFFGGGPWQLNNNEQGLVAWIFIGFLDLWFMPLFFLLSGVGAWYALESKSAHVFILDRSKRLLVPLYTVGLLVLNPPQFYFNMMTNKGFTGSFFDVIPVYFKQIWSFNIKWPGSFLPYPWPGHLWFVQFLFLITILLFPLLVFLKSEKGLAWISRTAGLFNRRGGPFLLVVPVLLIMISLRHFFSGRYTWAEFFVYAVFFFMGYIMPADKRFTESIVRQRGLALILGIAGFSLEGLFTMILKYKYPGNESLSLNYVLFNIVFSAGTCGWVMYFMALGSKYLNFNNKYIGYFNEAVLPFYLLHHPIILCVGFFIISLDLAIIVKYSIIVMTSFIIIMLVYHYIVRPFKIFRFLFGMR